MLNYSVKGDNRFRNIYIKTNKSAIFVDCILLEVGVKPNSEITKDTGIELGISNAKDR